MGKLNQQVSSSRGTSSGSHYGQDGSFSQDYSAMDSVAARFAKEHHMSKGQAASLLLAASGSLGVDSAKNAAGWIAQKLSGASGRFAGSADLNYTGKSSSSELVKAAHDYAKQTNFAQKWQQAMQSGTKTAESLDQKSGASSGHDYSGGFSKQRAASRNLSASLSSAQTWQEMANHMKENGAAGTTQAVAAAIQIGNQLYAQNGGATMQQLAAQSASTSGNSLSATQALNDRIKAIVQTSAFQKMAGVMPAPDSSNVDRANQTNQAAVQKASSDPGFNPSGQGNVVRQGKSNAARVQTMAQNQGVPTDAQVKSTANEIAQTASDRQNGVANKVDSGGDKVHEQGAPLQKEATERTAPGNQDHMANAIGQVAAAGIDNISDITGMAANYMDHLFDGGLTGTQESGQKPDQPKKTWVNPLN